VDEPEVLHVDVDGASIGALHWPAGQGRPTVVTVHGITANAWSWATVARELAGSPGGAIGVVAVDLRGRGTSAAAPGPFGMRRHADDVAAVADVLDLVPAVVVGHSMGTYVALMCADRHPEAVASLVLVDGGIALPMPPDVDPQAVLDATLGPAIARLRQVFTDRDAYRSMWAQHPALAHTFTPDVERYALADLVETDGGWRSCVSEDAVRFDGGELLTDDEVRAALDRHAGPLRIVRAETGLMAQPPALIPVEMEERYPQHAWTTVPGANHYDVLVGHTGAATVAEEIRAALAAVAP
jgi:pimeloyl-ACP methyl ester carboxylesterase